MRIYTILPGLYQSARFTNVVNKVDMLQALGINRVVSLWKLDPDLEACEEIRYDFHRMPDGKTLHVEPLNVLADILACGIILGDKCLCHCYGGRNRSAFLNTLIVRELKGCTGAQALAIVRAGRPGSVVNPVFEAHLLSLSKP
jgi:protein-tyrosine phosphatase